MLACGQQGADSAMYLGEYANTRLSSEVSLVSVHDGQ
jgi:hypothetical protein